MAIAALTLACVDALLIGAMVVGFVVGKKKVQRLLESAPAALMSAFQHVETTPAVNAPTVPMNQGDSGPGFVPLPTIKPPEGI